MDLIITLLMIMSFWGSIKAQGSRNYAAHEMDCQLECEVGPRARQLARLLLAEDVEEIRNTPITELMLNHPEIVQAYHDYVSWIIVEAELGPRPLRATNSAENNARLAYFTQVLREEISEIVRKSCFGAYRFKLESRYNNDTREIYVREVMNSVSEDSCLGERGGALNENIQSFTDDYVNHYYTHTRVIFRGETSFTVSTTDHYVIPLELFVDFFKKWLNDAESPENLLIPFNQCFQVSIYRTLRRNMLKILSHSLVRSRQFLSEAVHVTSHHQELYLIDAFFSNIFGNARSWLSGNIIVATSDWERHEDITTIDSRAAGILDLHHFQTLEFLFDMLKNYIKRDVDPFTRLLNGLTNYVSLKTILSGFEITQLGPNQRNTNRPKRSLMGIAPKIDPWNESILKAMQVSIRYRAEDKHSLSWQCDFDRIQDDFFRQLKPKVYNCLDCQTLAKHILLKISKSKDWKKCNDGIEVSMKGCDAWKRINQILKRNANDINEAEYSNDVIIFMDWVLRTIISNKHHKSKFNTTAVLSAAPIMDFQEKIFNPLQYASPYRFEADEAQESLFLFSSLSKFID